MHCIHEQTASLEQLRHFFADDPFHFPPAHSEHARGTADVRSPWSDTLALFNTSELARRHAVADARRASRERLALTLSFTHDLLPDWYLKKKHAAPSSLHAPPLGGSSGAGQGLGDATDAGDVWDEDQVEWHALDWISLPGSPSKAPRWDGPYHRMLDWHVWLHVSAAPADSSEAQELAPGGAGRGRFGRRRRVPPAVSALASKVLAGDTFALALLQPSFVEVMGSSPSKLPSAVKAEWWLYSFGQPGSVARGLEQVCFSLSLSLSLSLSVCVCVCTCVALGLEEV